MPRYPTPIPIRRATGNPQNRPMGSEPNLRKLMPEIAAWLDQVARDWLEEIRPKLMRASLITEVDSATLGMMADRYAEVLAWRELVQETGIARAAALGYVREMRRAEDSFRKWQEQFGLSALSRTKFAASSGDRDDESDLDTTG